MRPGASRHWEDKSFFDQNKNKRNFQRRFNKENYNNPPTTKLFNYYTRKANNNYQENSQPGNTIFKINLITTRPQAPTLFTKTKRKLTMKKLCKNVSSIQRVY